MTIKPLNKDYSSIKFTKEDFELGLGQEVIKFLKQPNVSAIYKNLDKEWVVDNKYLDELNQISLKNFDDNFSNRITYEEGEEDLNQFLSQFNNTEDA